MTHAPKLAAPARWNPRIPPAAEVEISCTSSVENLDPMVDRVMRFMQPLFDRCSRTSASDVELAIHEAVANAMVHGNNEDSDKRVYLCCRQTIDGEVWITVRDEGEGFDPNAITQLPEPDNLLLTHGRGIYMMRALMDEITFEDRGTVVRMRKRL